MDGHGKFGFQRHPGGFQAFNTHPERGLSGAQRPSLHADPCRFAQPLFHSLHHAAAGTQLLWRLLLRQNRGRQSGGEPASRGLNGRIENLLPGHAVGRFPDSDEADRLGREQAFFHGGA